MTEDKAFAYRASKGGLIFLPILLIFCAITAQSSLTSGRASQPNLVLAVTCLLYGLAFITFIWAFAWFKAPPVLSGNMDQVTIKSGLFEDAITLRWVDIHTIRFSIKTHYVENRSTKEHYLHFMHNSGEMVTLQLDLIDVSQLKIQEQISEIAPHIKWVIED